MKASNLLLLPLLLLALPFPAFAGASLFLGGGPAGSSDFGFRGGWGLALGVELPITPFASAVLRADHHDLPDAAGDGYPIVIPLDATVLGKGPSSARAHLRSVMVGFRLHPPSGRLQTYADALLGVGHLDLHAETGDPSIRDDTNLGFSFGAGLAVRPLGAGRIFADAHYDYYLVEGMDSPIVPLRMGLAFP